MGTISLFQVAKLYMPNFLMKGTKQDTMSVKIMREKLKENMADYVIGSMSPGRFLSHVCISVLLTSSSSLIAGVNIGNMQLRPSMRLMRPLVDPFEEVCSC
jgi:hypothetical protein